MLAEHIDHGLKLRDALVRVRSNWGWFVALGLGLIILGVLAMGFAVLTTISTMIFFGILMVMAAAMHVVAAIRAQEWQHSVLWGLGALLYLLAGVGVIVNPILASTMMTLLVAAGLMVAGVVRIWMSFHVRPGEGWGYMALAGVLTAVLGVLIAIGWPVDSLWMIGTLIGIQIVIEGWAMLVLGLAVRNNPAMPDQVVAAAGRIIQAASEDGKGA